MENCTKITLFKGYAACSTNCVQLGVACGLLSYGLKCKLLFDVFELTNNCTQLTRTHQRYCVGDDCSEASQWSPHNHECSSC